MINNIVLVGRTTKNIELKQNKNGTNYVQFTLAVNRPYKDEQGGQQADFIACVAWNKTAETLANYVSKGAMIGVEGRLQVRTYDNEAGVRQYISEVLVNKFTFLESKKSSALPEPVEPANYQQNSEISSHHSF
ncbi:MAG: single-stranded DNA-binding protein, partial [Turicibacter sp.]|nr:single-stranded DNA-binding protein [Turicibacter sp.]